MSTIADAATQLAGVLAAIEDGELSCSTVMRRRLEGAQLALTAMAERPANGRLPDGSGDHDG